MQPATSKAILLIADISGFTRFMRLHRMAISHAKQIVVRLLQSIISASTPPLTLAELEGDAAFFYALSAGEKDLPQTLAAVKTQIPQFFRSFYQALYQTRDLRLCVCEACMRVEELRLKIVMHAGDIAIARIEKFEKLFGLDVILVHRLLKNPLPAREYILMTREVYRQLDGFHELQPEKCRVDCEGIGRVETLVFYPPPELTGLPSTPVAATPPSLWHKLRWIAQLDWGFLRSLLPGRQ
ncbi:MAG: DUF2652 domain-containing protein [candidate division KSB1 bacterium]|nr:DUF2652 domain-containing protein [candidate division KSB1 bacterium]MDZ7275158.1 DUF2652 domain-containing protein [candidate division KSB1 bacterium]MDZ7287327.1 DUF2652 domain-containing protein [candidate division KSB1 bacterium]MDZ7299441.1 DUF2652 domain-containing protein [candidate division KSB1 bacterium]MDZ7305513.1 DUF2652 domain-containing protein [candidate division KSB1 bacterium]